MGGREGGREGGRGRERERERERESPDTWSEPQARLPLDNFIFLLEDPLASSSASSLSSRSTEDVVGVELLPAWR